LGEVAATVLFLETDQLRAFLLRLLDGVRMRLRIVLIRMGRGLSNLESRRVAWSHRVNDVLAVRRKPCSGDVPALRFT